MHFPVNISNSLQCFTSRKQKTEEENLKITLKKANHRICARLFFFSKTKRGKRVFKDPQFPRPSSSI
jgi:hypothetical protein